MFDFEDFDPIGTPWSLHSIQEYAANQEKAVWLLLAQNHMIMEMLCDISAQLKETDVDTLRKKINRSAEYYYEIIQYERGHKNPQTLLSNLRDKGFQKAADRIEEDLRRKEQ